MSLSWAKLSLRHKCLIFTSSIVLFGIIFHILILAPQNTRIAELNVKHKTVSLQNVGIQDFVKKHPNTGDYFNEINRRVSVADAMLPNEPDMAVFLLQVEQAAKENGLQLGEFKPATAINKTAYREIPVEIGVKGSFTQVSGFLQRLENVARFNTVSTIAVNSRQNQLDIKLTLIAYSYGVPPGEQQGQQPKKQN